MICFGKVLKAKKIKGLRRLGVEEGVYKGKKFDRVRENDFIDRR